MAKHLTLNPKRELLNPNFEGYKLTLDPLAIYEHALLSDISKARIDDSQYSLQHYKMYGLHNHLSRDPWNDETLYYVTNLGKVVQIQLKGFSFDKPHVVHSIPNAHHESGDYDVSIYFVSAQHVVFSDGKGTLQLLWTEDRSTSSSWKVLFNGPVDEKERAFVICHGILSSTKEIDVLITFVDDKSNVEALKNESSPFATIVTWVTLSPDKDDSWFISRIRKLAGAGDIEYAAINPKTQSVLIASKNRYVFIYDSVKPIQKKAVAGDTREKQESLYAWTQSNEEVDIIFKVAPEIKKEDISVKLTQQQFELNFLDGSLSVKGQLFANIDVEPSNWTIIGNKLEITVFKQERGVVWKEFLIGDQRGEEVDEPEFIAEIHARLAHLTSDVAQHPENPAFNPGQLEECDDFPSDFFTLVQFNGENHDGTKQINLSDHQWLFSTILAPEELPAFCVRHDVDGIVWQPSDQCDMQHKITFHALGYVQASKQDRRFSACSPDGSFAVICDVRKHVYVYRQPSEISSELRNRRTGLKIGSVARQHVVSLETTNEIIGLQASRECIFLLTNKHLYAVRVDSSSAQSEEM